MFIRVGDLRGGSTDAGHKDWSDVGGYTHGMRRVVGTGGTLGRPIHDPLQVMKAPDATSSALFNLAENRGVVNDVLVDVCSPHGAGGQKCFLRITLKGARIEAFAQSAATEALSFSYTRIEWRYTAFAKDGKPGHAVTLQWDVNDGAFSGETFGDNDRLGGPGGDGSIYFDSRDVRGEELREGFQHMVGIHEFARGVSSEQGRRSSATLQFTKGTDVATAVLIRLLHVPGQVEGDIRFGCLQVPGPSSCLGSFRLPKNVAVSAISYGASQRETVIWFLPDDDPKV